MKKAIFTLAVLVMAFANAGKAQQMPDLKNLSKEIAFRHFGHRDDGMKPNKVMILTADGESELRVTYTYDEDTFLRTEALYEVKYEDTEWENLGRLLYEYDFADNVIELLSQNWLNGDWKNFGLASYTYEDETLNEILFQDWDGGVWVNETKAVYNYTGDQTAVLYWDWTGTNWTSHELYTYTYSDSSIELVIQYMQGGAWQNDEKQTTTLDFLGNALEILVEDWSGSNWANDTKTTYDYEDGVYATQLVEKFTNGAWTDDMKFEYTYENGNATYGKCWKNIGGNWWEGEGDVEMAYNYGAEKDVYLGHEVHVEYLDVTGLDENSSVAGFKVYPVPAESEIQIQAENFQKAEIYSLTGQKLMESVQQKMNVSALSQGVYLLKVFDQSGKAETQRIVVK